jgi:hypothetical protein
MPTDLILPERPTNTQIGPLAEIADRASELIHNSKSKNTIRAYRADWEHFTDWCRSHGQASIPAAADTVALYITDLAATHKPSTITRRISAISEAHQDRWNGHRRWTTIPVPQTILKLPIEDQLAALPKLMLAYGRRYDGQVPFFGKLTGFKFVRLLDHLQFDNEGVLVKHVEKLFRRGPCFVRLR